MTIGETMGNSTTRSQRAKQKEQIMNSNFEWQKHQANERVREYFNEAASHRLAGTGTGRSRSVTLINLTLLAGIVLFGWIMTGCSSEPASALITGAVESVEVVDESQSSTWQMSDRISFQDKREAYLTESAPNERAALTMSERIQFQDKREAYLNAQTVHNLTMAERILFQDRVMSPNR
jgi:hypothetical protein